MALSTVTGGVEGPGVWDRWCSKFTRVCPDPQTCGVVLEGRLSEVTKWAPGISKVFPQTLGLAHILRFGG